MEIRLNPPDGIPPVFIGMPFEEAVKAAEVWGDVRVLGPTSLDPTVKIQAVNDGFDVLLILRDQKTVNAVDVSGPDGDDGDGDDGTDLRVLYDGVDVFRTPARQLLPMFADRGHRIDDTDPESPVVLDLTIAFSRWTSQDVPVDPEDGLPLYFTAALVSNENPRTP
ncbi:hypothetical protein GCM10009837_64320 [Streptomyces durmitorensis]|uniref:Uncharacterized protein n=1 Tax=Streptomyces durmitorensis TaxID=319947 RepID=A0ABY4PVN2_9ACTN|nr:hypothetical protein [Streptomyces durmitorensis]UQT57018.1 hypothetical protein M4V62_18985 [Streptomyces durmitorensis]